MPTPRIRRTASRSSARSGRTARWRCADGGRGRPRFPPIVREELPLRRAQRLYRITDYLRGRRLTTAAWLADRLEVSPRTIYRDIGDLVRAGIPVTGEAGVGYALTRRIDLPPLLFDRAELAALAVGARFVKAYGDEELADAAERAQSKIRGAVPRELAEGMRGTSAFVTRGGRRAAERLAVVLRAVDARSKLALAYRDEAGRETSRTIWPLGALFGARAWTIIGWCELREAFRSFRLDRIEELRVTRDAYPVLPGRRLEDFFSEMQALHGVAAHELGTDL